MEPEDLAVIGHTGDLLVDIYARNLTHIYITVVLNDGGKGAQSRRNGCSICAVEVRNLARNTQRLQPAASESDEVKIRVSHRSQSAENAVSGHDGYYKEMDWQTAGLERDPRTTGCVLRGSYAGLTGCTPACQGSR